MTLRHMKIFSVLYKNNCNMTLTAELLNMTQPAVSLAVKELESYYSAALFDRFGRRLVPTEAGKKFFEYSVRICSLFDETEKTLKGWDRNGILKIGASLTVGSKFLPLYVKNFQSTHPEAEIKAFVEPTSALEKKILENEIDFALIEGIPHSENLISIEYMEDSLSVICPLSYPYKNNETVSTEQFRHENILLREADSGTRELFDTETKKAGFTVTPLWESMSTNALINAVINGIGIAVLPGRIISAEEKKLIKFIKIENMEFTRKFRIVYHKDKYLTSSAKDFIDMCTAFNNK